MTGIRTRVRHRASCQDKTVSSRSKAAWHKGHVLVRATYDAEADASYFNIEQDIANGDPVEQYVIERKRGMIVLDFDKKGRLLGVEVIGAKALLTKSTRNFLRKLR